jgi:hypothetical protein
MVPFADYAGEQRLKLEWTRVGTVIWLDVGYSIVLNYHPTGDAIEIIYLDASLRRLGLASLANWVPRRLSIISHEVVDHVDCHADIESNARLIKDKSPKPTEQKNSETQHGDKTVP